MFINYVCTLCVIWHNTFGSWQLKFINVLLSQIKSKWEGSEDRSVICYLLIQYYIYSVKNISKNVK